MKAKKMKLDDKDRQRCEIWTRVMGYHRPVASFNVGKKGEYFDRRNNEGYFKEPNKEVLQCGR